MRIGILFLLAIVFMSCDCYIAQPTTPTQNDFLFIFWGESNSAGFADNASATSGELSAQSQVQIINNNTFTFQSLDIGTNNDLNNNNMYANKHGWELELSNRVTAEPSYYGDTVWLVKTGQNGSQVYDWRVQGADTSGGYMGKFKKRVDTAQYLLRNRNLNKVIFVSIGLNDAAYSTSVSYYATKMVENITTIRAITKETTPIVITKFFSPFTVYNNTIDSLANVMDSVYTVDGTSATLLDTYHWDYSGMKIITNRLLTVLKTIYP